ncbi:MAG: hypothetical protein IVW51_15415 [Thermaceae bacterium]|nr:hypothetical protein [Thermaceae bacterium]
MLNPWYKPLTSQPTNTNNKRRVLEVHLDNPDGAMAEGLEALAQSLYAAGGVIVPGTVSIAGTVLSAAGRLGVALDGSVALYSQAQTLDLAAVALGQQITAYLEASPIPQDTPITDPDTNQLLTHTTYLRLGKLAAANAATYPVPPQNAVPIAQLTRTAGGLTLDAIDVAAPKLRKILEGSAPLDFPAIAAGGIATLTIAVPGAQPGSEVTLGAPAALEAGLIGFGLVTAINTVTVRLLNPTLAAIDPAPATWKASVLVH